MLLQALPGKLSLHEADLLKDGSFDEIVKGADYVFHMASPFLSAWEDTQKELVEPALHGTTTVLESVAKSKDTVRRVVLTSSLAGVVFPLHDRSLLSPHATSDYQCSAVIQKTAGVLLFTSIITSVTFCTNACVGLQLH